MGVAVKGKALREVKLEIGCKGGGRGWRLEGTMPS